MAEVAGIPFPTYRDAENGKIPQDQNLARIADAMGVSPVALFQDPDLLPPPNRIERIIRKVLAVEDLDPAALMVVEETLDLALGVRAPELHEVEPPESPRPIAGKSRNGGRR
jgi:transcriptional regulator with XRE-family HTH domain